MDGEDFNELLDNELHLAVRVSDVAGTRQALEQGLDPNTIGLFEWSAVHEAAHNGEYEILKLLLKHGGSPNQRDYLNGLTALHYAATEGHPDCLELLLSHGGDATVKNEKGLTFPQMTRQKACKDVLARYGIEVTTSVHFEDLSTDPLNVCNRIPETSSPKRQAGNLHPPTSFNTKLTTKSHLSDGSFESGIGSRASLSDTGSISSAACRSPVLRGRQYSHLSDQPSSPCKSLSSFGSLTSIGSSIISGSDDCAGYIMLAFQYNSKTSQLKIRITEIVLTCLLPYQKAKKDASLHLYIGGKIYVPNEINLDANKETMQAKSEAFRLQPGGDRLDMIQEKDGSTKSFWREKDAKVMFLNTLMVEFADIGKEVVKESNIQISLCAKHKKNVLVKNSKASAFATLDLPLKDAVKRLMKETYELQPCHVHGITRKEDRLDQVLSEMVIDSGKSKVHSSDSNIRGALNKAFEMELVERSVSDGDLKQVTVDSPATVSPSSSSYDIEYQTSSVHDDFEGVQSHHPPVSPQVKLKMQTTRQHGPVLDKNEAKVEMSSSPLTEHHPKNGHKEEILKKATGKVQQAASTGARSLHRLVVSRHQTEVEHLQTDEEQSYGFLHEEIPLDTFSISNTKSAETKFAFLPSEHVDKTYTSSPKNSRGTAARTHVRTLSNDSFAKVDESSPSPSRRRRNLKTNVSDRKKTNNAHGQTFLGGNAHAETRRNSSRSPTVLMYEDSNDYGPDDHGDSPWIVESNA